MYFFFRGFCFFKIEELEINIIIFFIIIFFIFYYNYEFNLFWYIDSSLCYFLF